jgi:restriction system protein
MIDLTALMLLTVQALQQLGNSGHIKEIDDAISDLEGLTEDEQAILMPNGKHPRFNYFSAWSRTYLKKAGVVEIVKQGIWALVEGVELPKNYEQTRKLYLQVAKEARQEKKEKVAAASEDELESVEASDDGSSWMDQLLDVLKAMDPAGFERLAQRLLREAGFNKVRVLGQSNDGGIDGVGVLRVNLISKILYGFRLASPPLRTPPRSHSLHTRGASSACKEQLLAALGTVGLGGSASHMPTS